MLAGRSKISSLLGPFFWMWHPTNGDIPFLHFWTCLPQPGRVDACSNNMDASYRCQRGCRWAPTDRDRPQHPICWANFLDVTLKMLKH
jgi:hypothetical protein